jgi:hypothetical protein
MPPQYCECSIWDCVGFYTILTFLNSLVESQFVSFLKLIIPFWYHMILLLFKLYQSYLFLLCSSMLLSSCTVPRFVRELSAVHPNMRGHTGGGMTMGRGFPISVSTKQKLNTKSSTESELVGIDNMMPFILWTCYFLISQGYGVIENLLLQDNKSSILLERIDKASSGKRTRHFNIFITD